MRAPCHLPLRRRGAWPHPARAGRPEYLMVNCLCLMYVSKPLYNFICMLGNSKKIPCTGQNQVFVNL